MAEETEECSSETAAAAAPPPRKRFRLNNPPRPVLPPGGSAGPLALEESSSTLNLSRCHVCGEDPSPMPLETLDSLWRLLLLCPRCVVSLHSTLCSYCFEPLSTSSSLSHIPDGFADPDGVGEDCDWEGEDDGDGDDDFSCVTCGRTVHARCLAIRPPSRDSFACVDCWVPHAFSNRTSHDWKVSVFGDGSSSLEKVVWSASAGAKKAEMAAAKARNLADQKAFVAQCAAELAQSALDCAAACGGRMTARGCSAGGSNLGNGGVFEDKEMALDLHRAINCSPRFYNRRRCGSLTSEILVPLASEKQDSPTSSLGISSSSEDGCIDDSDSNVSEKEGYDETGRYGKTYRRKKFRAKQVDSSNLRPVKGELIYVRRKLRRGGAENLSVTEYLTSRSENFNVETASNLSVVEELTSGSCLYALQLPMCDQTCSMDVEVASNVTSRRETFNVDGASNLSVVEELTSGSYAYAPMLPVCDQTCSKELEAASNATSRRENFNVEVASNLSV